MRLDIHEPLNQNYKKNFESMWKESRALTAKNWFLTLKTKLKRDTLRQIWRTYDTLREGYKFLRAARRVSRAPGLPSL